MSNGSPWTPVVSDAKRIRYLEERIHELESKLSDLVAYCKDGYGDHEAAEIINAEKALESRDE